MSNSFLMGGDVPIKLINSPCSLPVVIDKTSVVSCCRRPCTICDRTLSISLAFAQLGGKKMEESKERGAKS